MRVSLVARFVSHPSIRFLPTRHRASRPRLGLTPATTVYHRPHRAAHRLPTIGALRCQTSRFRFPSVGRVGRVRSHRAALPLGISRGRRA